MSTLLRRPAAAALQRLLSHGPLAFAAESADSGCSQSASYCSAATDTAAAAAPTVSTDTAAAAAPTVSTESVKPPKKPWSMLSTAAFGALTGAGAAAVYVTYAYTLEEVEEKAISLHRVADYKVGDDASAIDKLRGFFYSTIGSVAAKTIDFYTDVRRKLEESVREFADPSSEKLLPDLRPEERHVFTLVLDLNETLIYTEWKRERGWKTFKRPGVEDFLDLLSQYYEIVIYSDQINFYVDPVCDKLDPKRCMYRLSRSATKYIKGNHYRDLSKLNRDPSHVLYISAHALENCLQRENCISLKPYKLEEDDTALLDLLPFLLYVAKNRPHDIRPVLASYQGCDDIAKEFLWRSREHYRKMNENKKTLPFWRQ